MYDADGSAFMDDRVFPEDMEEENTRTCTGNSGEHSSLDTAQLTL